MPRKKQQVFRNANLVVDAVDVGRVAFDGRRAIANAVTEYFEHICHTVLFNYGGYPQSVFETVSYHQILLRKCKAPEATGYINSCLRTIHRWIQYMKLERFAVRIEDEEGKIIVEYVSIVYDAYFTGCKRIDNFADLLVDLQNQFARSLTAIQMAGPEDGELREDIGVRLVIRAQLLPNTSVKKCRPAEYIWKEAEEEFEHKKLIPCGDPINSRLFESTLISFKEDSFEVTYDIDSVYVDDQHDGIDNCTMAKSDHQKDFSHSLDEMEIQDMSLNNSLYDSDDMFEYDEVNY